MHSTIFGHSLSELKEGTFDLLDKRLGGMYRDGQGVLQDYQEVIKWCRLAAEQGMHEAQYDLGVRYYHGQGVPKDYKEAASGFDLPQIREMLRPLPGRHRLLQGSDTNQAGYQDNATLSF